MSCPRSAGPLADLALPVPAPDRPDRMDLYLCDDGLAYHTLRAGHPRAGNLDVLHLVMAFRALALCSAGGRCCRLSLKSAMFWHSVLVSTACLSRAGMSRDVTRPA